MGSSHHGDGPIDPEASETFRKQFESARDDAVEHFAQRMVPNIELGAQHDHPEGEYGPNDEGALAFAVGHDADNTKVVVDFGEKPVTFLAMGPQQAMHFAQLLVNHATAVGSGPLALEIGRALRQREKRNA